ncbi:MAG: hypothetical protein HQK99_01660 [Nitrospirae bacterium]|nr:hypothetical protein [Nitrospirota bacterium]
MPGLFKSYKEAADEAADNSNKKIPTTIKPGGTAMLITYESYIPEGSKAVGRTIRSIEEEFGVKVDHYHNSPIQTDTRYDPKPEVTLEPGMSIKLQEVDSDILTKFCRKLDLP